MAGQLSKSVDFKPFGEKGFVYSPISKKWEVSAWYKKQGEGKGFAGKDYNFGFSLGRKF